jgi:gliding motility-associated-like protein
VVSEVPYATFKQSRNVVHIPSEEIFFTNLSEHAKSYFWDFGDGNYSSEKNPVYTYTDTGRFTITLVAISENGCSDTATVEKAVLATAEGTIKVPNAFTPSLVGSASRNISSEGLNDIFKPIVEGITEIEMQIFNRWGEVMYSCKGQVCDGWNGHYKGKLCKQDVYIYNIKCRLKNGEIIEKVGDVMLLN